MTTQATAAAATPTVRYAPILAEARLQSRRQWQLVAAVVAVCVAALAITGFFDATRFIESGPALQQLA